MGRFWFCKAARQGGLIGYQQPVGQRPGQAVGLHHCASLFDRRIVHLHRELGFVVVDPHIEFVLCVVDRLRLTVIDLCIVLDAVQKRDHVRVFHDALRQAPRTSVESNHHAATRL